MSALLAAILLAAAQAPPVFRADVEVVRVDVLATRGGRPVHGLAASDFELRDDGRAQALEPVVEQETAVDAVLVLDLSASVRGTKLAALKAAAAVFLDGLRAGERAALLTFNEELRLREPLTSDLQAIRRALEQASSRGSTALVDALYAALRLAPAADRRTVVVVFSDGIDTLSWLAPSSVVEAAGRSNSTVYAVRVRAPGERKERFLGEVARATGGRLFEVDDERELQQRFLDVLEDIRARYVLRFTPGDARPGWHALSVRLKRGRADVLARPGYWRRPPS